MPDALAEVFLDLVDGKLPDADARIAAWNGRYTSLFAPTAKLSQVTYATAPASETAALPASVYVGTYLNAYLGAVQVTETNGALNRDSQ